MVNRMIKARAKSIGVSNVIDPRHIVATQLKTFTPVGTAINMVQYIKNNSANTGIPVVNIWCAHTKNDRIAILAVAYTMDE